MLFRNIDIPFLVKSRVLDEPKYSTSSVFKHLLKSLNFELFDQKVSQNPGQKTKLIIYYSPLTKAELRTLKVPNFEPTNYRFYQILIPRIPSQYLLFYEQQEEKVQNPNVQKSKIFFVRCIFFRIRKHKKIKGIVQRSQKISIFYIFIPLTTRSLKESVKTRIPYQHCAKWFFYNYYISPFIDHS